MKRNIFEKIKFRLELIRFRREVRATIRGKRTNKLPLKNPLEPPEPVEKPALSKINENKAKIKFRLKNPFKGRARAKKPSAPPINENPLAPKFGLGMLFKGHVHAEKRGVEKPRFRLQTNFKMPAISKSDASRRA